MKKLLAFQISHTYIKDNEKTKWLQKAGARENQNEVMLPLTVKLLDKNAAEQRLLLPDVKELWQRSQQYFLSTPMRASYSVQEKAIPPVLMTALFSRQF